MRTILLTFGLIVLLALPAMGAQLDSDQADVTLEIQEYAYIDFDDPNASFDIIIDPGDWSSPTAGDCESEAWTAGANFSATTKFSISVPSSPNPAPGSWSGSWNPATLSPGVTPGTAEVCVNNIDISDGTGTWTGGFATISIWGP